MWKILMRPIFNYDQNLNINFFIPSSPTTGNPMTSVEVANFRRLERWPIEVR
jgi:hypothetical protein